MVEWIQVGVDAIVQEDVLGRPDHPGGYTATRVLQKYSCGSKSSRREHYNKISPEVFLGVYVIPKGTLQLEFFRSILGGLYHTKEYTTIRVFVEFLGV